MRRRRPGNVRAGGFRPRGGLLAAALAALVVGLAVPASAREIALEAFDAEIVVQRDGTLEVSEALRVRFTGAWNGIERNLPVAYRTPEGFAFAIAVDGARATDADGRPLRLESERRGHDRLFRIWVPDAADAVRAVRLRYRVAGALGFFARHDELYWNVTGDEWEMPIASASARIVLPAGASGLRAIAYTGAFGSQAQDAEVTITGDAVAIRTRHPLGFRQGLTAVVGWDKGLVRPPTALARTARFVGANWPLALPLATLALMGWLWQRYGRDPATGSIAPRYEPPDGLTPAEVGTLIDDRADLRDVTATLVDLAARGFLTIEEQPASGLRGLLGRGDYAFHRSRPTSEWSALAPHESLLLRALFERGESVELGDLEHRFYRHLPALHDALFNRLSERGFYRARPDRVRRRFLLAGGVLALASVAGAQFLTRLCGAAPVAWALGGLLSAGIVALIGRVMPARTLAGARALADALGFEEFLDRVESDRFARLERTPALFERFLPYAMALGVERQWARAFEGICREPPRWYRTSQGDGLGPGRLADALHGMASRTAGVMASAPRSAGGSGFGGGSSGGGVGGGGGRGF